MQRIGADEPRSMPRHGRSRSMGRAGGITRTTDTAPGGFSPGKGAISGSKIMNIARVSNGEAEGAVSLGSFCTQCVLRVSAWVVRLALHRYCAFLGFLLLLAKAT